MVSLKRGLRLRGSQLHDLFYQNLTSLAPSFPPDTSFSEPYIRLPNLSALFAPVLLFGALRFPGLLLFFYILQILSQFKPTVLANRPLLWIGIQHIGCTSTKGTFFHGGPPCFGWE